MHKIAKEIYSAMKVKKLDPLTKHTFKWNRKRLTAAERAQLALAKKKYEAHKSFNETFGACPHLKIKNHQVHGVQYIG